ncbi:hypothetical protein BB560_000867 [Smittium megazygosporum]|uniref:Elongation of fatty acids protein n=1 Tax=Smittium megazygosporum TaxID=133381 RepID=A0A2T9ZJ48_9FUNG|nr:hypothetical protein BB560_000867 [Smittium megazygosporum]
MSNLDSVLNFVLLKFGVDKSQWRYVSGSTFGSTWSSVLTVTALYLATIFSIKFALKDRKPFVLKKVTAFHNLFLSIISALLLLLFAELLIPPLREHGLFWSICSADNWTTKLELLYYFNYLIKWYEFVDTILLVLKKKPTPFLHVYHHSMTMILCFTQLEGSTTVSWALITINLFVHVIMYYYYYLTTLGIRVFWKKLVTVMQIVQFVIDLGFVYFCIYTYYAHEVYTFLPSIGKCSGSLKAAYFGCAIISSYLLLFVKFFFDTYSKNHSPSKPSTSTSNTKIGSKTTTTIPSSRPLKI